MLISEAYAYINPLHQNETVENEIVKVINDEIGIVENLLLVPALGNRINNYSYLSIQSLAFPTLFPFSIGNVTNRDRVSSISLTDSNQHLLKCCYLDNLSGECIYPFTRYDR